MENEQDKHVDFLGNELNIGDDVVFMQLNYRNLLKGKIVSLSKYKAKISHEKIGSRSDTSQLKNQIVKIK